MPIEMPKGLPFSVDTWTLSSKRKRHHFLTHAHRDHCQGISTHYCYPIYSTHLTKALILQYYPQLDDSLFVGIEIGASVVINDPDGAFKVTAFDANHCPGAVMFLFEGNFGNILHTGDCRLTPECLQTLPEKYVSEKSGKPRCTLDFVFLDCTFGKSHVKMPSKHSAIQQVVNCIWKHPNAPVVYLTCDLLGQEEILVNVSKAFGSKIFIDRETNLEFYKALTLAYPELLSHDPSSRFHILNGFPRLPERAQAKFSEARANFQSEPLILRPSAQWYACDEETQRERCNEAVRDQFGIWHVCYSMHSSREELEWALQLLAPKRVVSTTPGCWPMELDYVKKHCFNAKLASDDTFWKLLDISLDSPSPADISIEGIVQTCSESESQQTELFLSREILNLSPPVKRPPVTLFGRARVSLQENESVSINREDPNVAPNWGEQDAGVQEEDVVEVKHGKLRVEDTSGAKCVSYDSLSPTGLLSNKYNKNLRKLYRSMNVPVPRPLPSLMEFMNSKKRTKRTFLF